MPKKSPTPKAGPKKASAAKAAKPTSATPKRAAAKSGGRASAATKSAAKPAVKPATRRSTVRISAAATSSETSGQRPKAHKKAPPPSEPVRASGHGSGSRGAASASGSPAANGMSQSLHDLLGIAEDPLVAADPVSFLRSLGSAALATTRNPGAVMNAGMRFAVGTASALQGAAGRLIGNKGTSSKTPVKDKRFADEAFADHPFFYLLHQMYLVNQRFAFELLDSATLRPEQERKARFATQFLVDAMAPTNTLVGNPAALRKAMQTGGKSVTQGLRNMAHDVRYNGGWPAQVDSSGFEVGKNMAMTPGKVVYRSDLIELIQYEPQTPAVFDTPLLFCPPWINKYYIMDLAPQKSLIEWAVQHGHTCFAISYRNPDESMRDTTFEDYLMKGPRDAVRVVREITGAEQVNTLSVCLGGTLTAIALAYDAAIGDDSINTATFLNTHTDFSEPGVLGTFTDESSIAALEKRMAKKGYLEASQMAHTFDAIRANDLVFQYVVNNWLMGEKPPAFDLLAWNNDSTRMPAKMHSAYLRSCYLRNEFSRGELVIDGVRLDPGAVSVDAYVLSAVDDHIVPWISAYKTARLLGGDNRFVLSTSGHIAGIVNPPSPKAKHWTNPELPADPQMWVAGATLQEGTWWQDWIQWIASRAGDMVDPPQQVGTTDYPILCDAPGTFVLTRA
ncbi:MAG: alpha/beta fold hydrolase [Acidimicrobiales bacterium]